MNRKWKQTLQTGLDHIKGVNRIVILAVSVVGLEQIEYEDVCNMLKDGVKDSLDVATFEG